MNKKCISCGTRNNVKNKNIIPKSLLRKANSKYFEKSDEVNICDVCYNKFSCKSDFVVQNMCRSNGFVYLSDHKISQEIEKLHIAASILISKPDFITEETLINSASLIKNYLNNNYTRKDLNKILNLKNDGKNIKLHVGAFLRDKIGTGRLFSIFRSNFYEFINSDDIIIKPKRERKEKYEIQEVFEEIKIWHDEFNRNKNNKWINLDGDPIDISSYRYDLFYEKGCKCVSCGIEGKYFVKEKVGIKPFHLNLYGVNEEGEEVMMTVDHIYPKSKGGKDELENYQPMCAPCNSAKGNKII
jgi:hypothetical protein